jgi:hypothetical protein
MSEKGKFIVKKRSEMAGYPGDLFRVRGALEFDCGHADFKVALSQGA